RHGSPRVLETVVCDTRGVRRPRRRGSRSSAGTRSGCGRVGGKGHRGGDPAASARACSFGGTLLLRVAREARTGSRRGAPSRHPATTAGSPLLRDPLGLVLEEQLAPRLVRLEREARLAVGFPLAL